jgi:hypothetical protein
MAGIKRSSGDKEVDCPSEAWEGERVPILDTGEKDRVVLPNPYNQG